MKKILVALIVSFIAYQLFLMKLPDLTQEISLQHASVHHGDLVLINRDVKLKEEPQNLTRIPENISENLVVDAEFLLQDHVIKPLQEMLKQAEKDGVWHFKINSAYRDATLQQQLYDENGPNYALPAGYSEHQSGLSLDIGSTEGMMDHAREGAWLEKNAHNFGFVVRYPKGKTDVTGIEFEPWHFRYVGLPHSIVMKKKDFVLEEYLAYLKTEREHQVRNAGTTYYIQYDQSEMTDIPETTDFDISGDNTSGFVITSVVHE
ncbi:D-alanyl-D-alanine carboxypeptidase family protein [Exiguobacterium sp. SL-10]|uniref:M15 family metallopeptidase n=1 Tax=Exiguobacterium sp. SL-10 TaxID=2510962 RepID=UPI00103AECFE|nr:M15 family metallopeptidase [Exiguobacterium sp. SL-10]TCI30255.1 D-alanyl-D-alanine carboxypeptidase family protein [Exiguobacterium sp. SL-10]